MGREIIGVGLPPIPVIANKSYTFSFYVKALVNDDFNIMTMHEWNDDTFVKHSQMIYSITTEGRE